MLVCAVVIYLTYCMSIVFHLSQRTPMGKFPQHVPEERCKHVSEAPNHNREYFLQSSARPRRLDFLVGNHKCPTGLPSGQPSFRTVIN